MKYIKFIINGLWLSMPTVGLSMIVTFGDMQSSLAWIALPVILGFPWNIPGLIIMLGAGLSHGGSIIFFFLGGFWVFIAVSINGSKIYSIFKNRNKRKSNKVILIITFTLIFTLILTIYFLTYMAKRTKEGHVINQYLIECADDEIVTRKSSSIKVYLGNKEMGRLHQANYYYFGDLKGNTITINTQSNNLSARAIKCIKSTSEFNFILSNKYLKDSILNSKNL